MFKRIAMLLRGLMGNQSTAPSLSAEVQPSPSAKRSRVKSTQASPQAARSPAKLKTKPKSKAAPSTSAGKSRKAAPKPAQTTSGKRGRPRKIPA